MRIVISESFLDVISLDTNYLNSINTVISQNHDNVVKHL